MARKAAAEKTTARRTTARKPASAKRSSARGKGKVEKVMHEYKEGTLKSGSKRGPKVKSRKQAVAIALSEARHSGAKIAKKKTAKKRA